MAWHDDSVPDGIGDDPPMNDVARSRQGKTHNTSHTRGMGQSAFCIHFAVYYLGL